MTERDDFNQLDSAADTPPVDPATLETDDELLRRLAGLSALEYERTRQAAAERLGIRPAALDSIIKQLRNAKRIASEQDEAGRGVLFEEVELWPEALDGAALLSELALTIRRFVICQPETAHAAALWAVMTWLIDVVQVAPIANITAPERNCGKSVMLTTLGRLSKRPLMASNITPAALFRAVEQWQPTLLIDEADAFADENEELRGLINSGHTRDSAFVVRVVGDDHEPRTFTTWSAKAMAGIGKRAGTIESRAIPLQLRRKLPHERTERLRSAEADKLFAALRRKLARWADDSAGRLADYVPDIPVALRNRNADNWEPLLSIADLSGGDWPKIARHAALTLSGVEDAPSLDQELLGDIREVFEARKAARMFSADLLAALIEDEERSWATYNRGRPMSAKQLANRMKGYGIKAKQIKIGATNRNGYDVADFSDAFARYLSVAGVPSSTTLQANNHAGFSDFSNFPRGMVVEDAKTPKALSGAACRVVEDRGPVSKGANDGPAENCLADEYGEDWL